MKTYLLTILLFFSCFSFVSAQKKYSVKIKTLDNHIEKGWLFSVKDEGILILRQQQRFNPKNPENNIQNTKFIDFKIIRELKVRKRGSVGKGVLIGFLTTFGTGILVARSPGIDLGSAFLAVSVMPTFGGILGGFIGGSYPHKFEVKKDSTSIQSLKIELKKYEWYHADKDTLNTK